jgi:hypothetical protein
MKQAEFLNACSTLLGLTCDAMPACLTEIEKLLDKPNEIPRRQDLAREYLRRLLGAGAADEFGVRIRSMLASEQGMRTSRDYGFEHIQSVEDPEWFDWIERYAAQPDREAMRELGERFRRLMEMAQPTDERLLKTRTLMERILNLGDAQSFSSSRALRGWLEQAQGAERRARIEHCLESMRDLRKQGKWADLGERLAKANELAPWGESQAQRLQAFRDEYAAWRAWRVMFTETLDKLDNFRPAQDRLLPWPRGIAARSQREALAGLSRWGKPKERQEMERALRALAKTVETSLSDVAHPDPIGRLETERAIWSEAAGDGGFPAPNWESVGEILWREAESAFESWRKRIRANYAGGPLEGAPTRRSPAANARLAELRRDAERLAELRGRLRDWDTTARPELLHDAIFDATRASFEKLKGSFGASPLFGELWEDFDRLRADLAVWARAENLRAQGGGERLREALESMARTRTPAVLEARSKIEREREDLDLIDCIRSGVWDGIGERLETAGAPARKLWERVRAGRAFLESKRRKAEALAKIADFAEFAHAVVGLLRDFGDPDLEYCQPDYKSYKELDEDLADQALRAAEQALRVLRGQCRPYPLPAREPLVRWTGECARLREGLSLHELARAGGAELLTEVDRLDRILALHDHIWRQAWPEAENLLRESGECLEEETRRGLAAVLETERLRLRGGADSEWLRLFLRYPGELLAERHMPARYLSLLRNGDASERDLVAHAQLLERRFPGHLFTRGLLLSLAGETVEALSLLEQAGLAPEEDWPLLGRALTHCAEERPVSRRFLELLWRAAPPASHIKIWPRQPDPLAMHRQIFERRAAELECKQDDPALKPSALLDELRTLEIAFGYSMPESLRQMLEDLDRVSRRMGEIERSDPWGLEIEALLKDTRGRCEFASIATACRARGWTSGVQKRLDGAAAWKKLWEHWREFRGHYDRLPPPGVQNPEGWQVFVATLELWNGRLSEAAARIDFGLSRASESAHWISFRSEWQQCREGILAEPARERIGDLPELASFYQDALEQTQSFAELHRRLTALPPCRCPETPQNPEIEGALQELHVLRPLTQPVAVLRERLRDPGASDRIGIHYRAWLERRR